MNIYGFLIALVVCAALVAIIWRITMKAINIRIIRTTEVQIPKIPTNSTDTQDKTPYTERAKEDNKVFQPVQMDAVISAVNEMMGIGKYEEGDNNE